MKKPTRQPINKANTRKKVAQITIRVYDNNTIDVSFPAHAAPVLEWMFKASLIVARALIDQAATGKEKASPLIVLTAPKILGPGGMN